jgi:hypothetical protein
MDLIVNMSGLTIGKKYALLKYDWTTWPKDSDFTTKAIAHATFIAASTTHVFPEQLLGDAATMSSGNGYFACVLASDTNVSDDNLIVLELKKKTSN